MKMIRLAAFSVGLALVASPAFAIKVGSSPKDFSLKGHDGKTYKLSDYKDKRIVLEWFNDDCPYVEKHYDSKNMQNLQAKYTEKDVVWFSVISSAPGKQGHLDEKGAKEIMKKRASKQTAILFDQDGKVGKYFGAKTTPHMYIINKGKLVYMGGIDDKPSAKQSSLEGATPLFANALDATIAGKKVKKSTTKPYGCSVKYK